MKRSEIAQHCTELVTPIIEENNFELVDVEYVKEGAYVKCFDEKLALDEGVRINCEDVRKGIDTYARKHKPATKESRPIGFAPVTVDAIN